MTTGITAQSRSYFKANWRLPQRMNPRTATSQPGGLPLCATSARTTEHARLGSQEHVRLDDRYKRPTGVDSLIGNLSEAGRLLDCKAGVLPSQLARIVVARTLTRLVIS